VISPHGGLVRVVSVQLVAEQLAPTPVVAAVLAMYPGGDLLVRAAPQPLRPPPLRDSRPERLLRVTVGMQLRQEVAILPLDTWRVYGIAPPFNPAPLLAVSPDGGRIAIATSAVEGDAAGRYTIAMLSSTGDTLYNRQHPFTLMAIPRNVADSARPREAALGALYGRAGQLASSEMRIPPAYQPLSEILAGSDGGVWLRSRVSPAAFHWMLLDPGGAPAGAVDVERPVAGGMSALWSAQVDASGTPQLVRHRVRRGGGRMQAARSGK
jgi:hypothetical protein